MSEKVKRVESGSEKLTRRQFLRDAGLMVGGATVGSVALVNACQGAEKETITGATVTKTVTTTVAGPGGATVTVTPLVESGDVNTTAVGEVRTINITINNEEYSVKTTPEWSLQYLLHDVLGFTSVKDMCTGYGACGTCTAVINGKPALTCMMLAIECDGARIETAEGLARANHPLIQAYIDFDCMQCGFCTPGFITTAKALLDRNPNPTEDDIKEALAGNLCRCGTYPQHVPAVLQAAKKTGGK